MKRLLLLIAMIGVSTAFPWTYGVSVAQAGTGTCPGQKALEQIVGVSAGIYDAALCQVTVLYSESEHIFVCAPKYICMVSELRPGTPVPWVVVQGGTGQKLKGFGGKFIFVPGSSAQSPYHDICKTFSQEAANLAAYENVVYRQSQGWNDCPGAVRAQPAAPTTISVAEALSWCKFEAGTTPGAKPCDREWFSQVKPDRVRYSSPAWPITVNGDPYMYSACPKFDGRPWYVALQVETHKSKDQPYGQSGPILYDCQIDLWVQ